MTTHCGFLFSGEDEEELTDKEEEKSNEEPGIYFYLYFVSLRFLAFGRRQSAPTQIQVLAFTESLVYP